MTYTPVSLSYSLELLSLGRNTFWKIKIFLFWVVLFLKRHLNITSRNPWFFKFIHSATPFYFYLADEIDVQSFVGVVIRGEYEFDQKTEPRVIVDLGSNIGTSILYFRLKYPNAVIYGFEPNPEIFPLLNNNVSQFQNIYLYSLAISDGVGKVKLGIRKEKSSASSIVINRKSDATEVDSIDLQTLKEMIGCNIDLLKFDVEGAEEKIFSVENLTGIYNLIGEIHPDVMKTPLELFLSQFKEYSIVLVVSGAYILAARRL